MRVVAKVAGIIGVVVFQLMFVSSISGLLLNSSTALILGLIALVLSVGLMLLGESLRVLLSIALVLAIVRCLAPVIDATCTAVGVLGAINCFLLERGRVLREHNSAQRFVMLFVSGVLFLLLSESGFGTPKEVEVFGRSFVSTATAILFIRIGCEWMAKEKR